MSEPSWRTDRLVLRPVRPGDAEAFLTWRSRPEVVRYMYQPPWTAELARERLARWAGGPFAAPGDVLVLAIATHDHPAVVIGEALLKRLPGDGQAEVGYALHPDASGYGYATEAVQAVLRLGFQRYGFHRIIARIDEENSSSIRVCERLGLRREARLVENDRRPADGRWATEVDYAILDREFGRVDRAEPGP